MPPIYYRPYAEMTEVLKSMMSCLYRHPEDLSTIPQFSLEGRTLRRVRVAKVYDGDTMTICARMSGKLWRFQCRLVGIDAAELRGESREYGQAARQTLLRYLDIAGDPSGMYSPAYFNSNPIFVDVSCGKFDKYGRLLIQVRRNAGFVPCAFSRPYVNDALANEEHFNAYDGGTKKAFQT